LLSFGIFYATLVIEQIARKGLEGLKMTIYIAKLETTNFAFAGYGANSKEALTALKTAFEAHIKKHNATLTWAEVRNDSYLDSVRLGEGTVR